MTREILHRLIVNGTPQTHRLPAADYYRPERNKKRLAGRVDPAKVAATKFHYLFAKYGPVKVAKDYLGFELGICTCHELVVNRQWLETNEVFRSAKVKPQTLKSKLGYEGSDIALLVPKGRLVISRSDVNNLIEFMTAFFYVHDHFPGATEANLRDPDRWKLWLGLFVAGCSTEGAILTAQMADHIQSLDKTMESWYPRR